MGFWKYRSSELDTLIEKKYCAVDYRPEYYYSVANDYLGRQNDSVDRNLIFIIN